MHGGARMMCDAHRGYNGYLLTRGGHTVGFAGDTAWTPAFARLNDPVRPIDLMLMPIGADRKSTRLNSSHQIISYAVFCLKKKNDPLIAPSQLQCTTIH